MSCSRGLPESCVMMTLSRSTVRMRSRITRYWLMGTSSESSCFPPSPGPSLLARPASLLERGERIPAARPLLPAALGDDRIEHQRRVADHGMVDAVLLVDVGGVVGGMDDGLARRHAGPERGAGEARARGQPRPGLRHARGG